MDECEKNGSHSRRVLPSFSPFRTSSNSPRLPSARWPTGSPPLLTMKRLKFRPLPPLELLNERLRIVEIPPGKYGEWSGLVWQVNRGPARVGSVAGCLSQNPGNPKRKDWKVRIDGVDYLASRVIYYTATGEDPGEAQVDHEDQNWLNNNAWKLRLDVDRSVQQVNSPKPRNNTSGVVDVCWDKSNGKWMAKVSEDGKLKYLGRYNCKIEAARVVNEKWIEMEWDKKGRELNDLKNINCNCRSCV